MLEQERAIRQVLSNDRKTSHLVPSWQDIDVLESLDKALSPLADLTDILSGEKYVTISSVKPLLHHMTSDILIRKEGDTQLTRDIKKKISAYLEKKYENIEVNELLDVATFLDPRFKMKFVEESDKDSVQERVVREGTYVAEQLSEEKEDNSRPESTGTAAVVTAPPAKKPKLCTLLKLSMGGGDSSEKSQSLNPEEKAKAEVESYLRVPEQDVEGHPLHWWKAEERKYPILATLARKYLCVCASSSASERLFSTVN